MRVGIFTPWYNPQHTEILRAFASQIEDYFLSDVREYQECDVAVIFGGYKRSFSKSIHKKHIMEAHAPRPLVILERGFVRREEYWSAGIGDINGLAEFNTPEFNQPWPGYLDSRWEKLDVDLCPWVDNPVERVLVCGQVPWDVSVQDVNHLGWCILRVSECLNAGLEVRFAPHPYARKAGVVYGVPQESSRQVTLAEGLEWADAVVTYNSNSGVDAIIAGVPVVAEDERSMVYYVSSRSLDKLVRPNRIAWAEEIAYKQWTIDEFRQGLPWYQLRSCLDDMVLQ